MRSEKGRRYQGLKDGFQVLVSPRRFFAGQEGRRGVAEPLAFLVSTWVLLTLILGALAIHAAAARLSPVLILLVAIFGTLASVTLGLLLTGLLFAWGGILQLLCRALGGQGSYSGTVRATMYALAPLLLLGVIALVIPDPSGLRLSAIFAMAGLGYSLVLLAMGLVAIQRIHAGGAIGAAALSGVLLVGMRALAALPAWQPRPMAAGPPTGSPAPAVTLPDLTGREQTLGAYRGKILLLNFFASW